MEDDLGSSATLFSGVGLVMMVLGGYCRELIWSPCLWSGALCFFFGHAMGGGQNDVTLFGVALHLKQARAATCDVTITHIRGQTHQPGPRVWLGFGATDDTLGFSQYWLVLWGLFTASDWTGRRCRSAVNGSVGGFWNLVVRAWILRVWSRD